MSLVNIPVLRVSFKSESARREGGGGLFLCSLGAKGNHSSQCQVLTVAKLVVPVSGALGVTWLHHELQARLLPHREFTSAGMGLTLTNVGSRPLVTFSILSLLQNFLICSSRYENPPPPAASSLGQTSYPVLSLCFLPWEAERSRGWSPS